MMCTEYVSTFDHGVDQKVPQVMEPRDFRGVAHCTSGEGNRICCARRVASLWAFAYVYMGRTY